MSMSCRRRARASASAWSRCARAIEARRCRAPSPVILSPTPQSTSMRPHDASTSSGRIASWMRLRSSGGRQLLPQRPRHDAEHRAAVQPERAVVQRGQPQIAERQRRHRRDAPPCRAAPASARSRTPCAADGWMNATSDPSRAGTRLASSTSRTPRARQLRQRRAEVLHAQRDVVQPGPAPARDSAAIGESGARGLEQFQRRAAGVEHVRPDPLRGDLLGRLDLEARARRGRTPAPRRGRSTAMPT